MLNNSLFTSDSTKNEIKTVYSRNTVPIGISGNDAQTSEYFNICMEKHKHQNIMQIRLTSTKNKTFIFISTIDERQFEKIKLEQSLRVSFDQFLKHVTQMLDQCGQNQGKFYLQLTLGDDADSNYFQFIEQGTFKNLVHLSLPVYRAPLDLILFYVNESYLKLQDQNKINGQKISVLDLEILEKNRKIEQLNETINILKSQINDQEKSSVVRYKEQLNRMEQEFKHVVETKDFQRQEMEKQLTAFRARNDTLIKENYGLSEQLKKENKIKTQLQAEIEKLQEALKNQTKEMEQFKHEQSHSKGMAQKYEHIANDLRKQIQALEDKNHLLEKQNSEILAELDAERNICQIKRNGLKIATEDICNANTIIRKQLAEIAELQEKLKCRTQIVLEQERVIQEHAGKAAESMRALETAIQENNTRNEETFNRIKNLQSQTDSIERKYQNRVDDLQRKINSLA